MAPQVRGTFPQLYDNIDKDIEALLKSTLKETPPIYPAYYQIKSSKRKFERVMTVTPFGTVPEKDEGDDYAFDLIRPGWSVDFTHVEFGLGFSTTETALEDDEYDIIMRNAQWLAFSARYTQEVQAAVPLNTGFASTKTGDGVVLFSTSHTLAGGGTAQNTLTTNADLSITSLTQALIDIATNTKLESGQLMAAPLNWELVVPPALEMIGRRILNSAGLPGTADNDINPIKGGGRTINLVVNPQITSSVAWFLFARGPMPSLRSYKRIPLTLVPPMIDPYSGNKLYKVRFRQSWGPWIWQGSYGVAGV